MIQYEKIQINPNSIKIILTKSQNEFEFRFLFLFFSIFFNFKIFVTFLIILATTYYYRPSLFFHNSVVTEAIVAARGVGVQIKDELVRDIDRIFIHEGIREIEVIYYILIKLKNGTIKIPFTRIKPKLDVLSDIVNELNKIIE